MQSDSKAAGNSMPRNSDNLPIMLREEILFQLITSLLGSDYTTKCFHNNASGLGQRQYFKNNHYETKIMTYLKHIIIIACTIDIWIYFYLLFENCMHVCSIFWSHLSPIFPVQLLSKLFPYPTPNSTSFFYCNNPLRSVSTACVYMVLGPSIQAGVTYQWPYLWRKLTLSTPTTFNFQHLLS